VKITHTARISHLVSPVNTSNMQNCPFCDDFDSVYTDWEDRIGNYHYVECYGCDIRSPSSLNRDSNKAKADSIIRWNLWTLLVRMSGVKHEDVI